MDDAEPPSSVPTSSAPGPANDRIKRNTACTNCRDAKVKCSNPRPGGVCIRCLRLKIECVVDRSHKRISRRSKLEELAQEVRSIREAVTAPAKPSSEVAVGTGAAVPVSFIPPPPLPVARPLQQPSPQSENRPISGLSAASPVPTGQAIAGLAAGSGYNSSLTQTPSGPLGPSPVATGSAAPSEARALGSRVFCGEDIDFYFQHYFDCFHPYFPIVRVRDANKCYKNSPLLFWTIIATACRRYARHESVLQFLVDSLPKEVWSAVAAPPLSPPAINALILLCVWPLPNIRFLTNPAHAYIGITMNASLLIGLQTGRGTHKDFSFGPYKFDISDEEAAYTWAGYNIAAQLTASIMGYPTIGCLFNETIDLMLSDKDPFGMPRSFKVLLECQRFYNRASNSFATCIEECRGVPSHLVDNVEQEFRIIQNLLAGETSDLDNFTLLSTLLSVQLYYFLPPPDVNATSLRRNCFRAYSTAAAIIRASIQLESSMGFLSHGPDHIFRTVLTAGCVVVKVMRSGYRAELIRADPEADGGVGVPGAGEAGEEALAKETFLAIHASSVQEGDLPARAARLFDSYWSLRAWFPVSELPTSTFAARMGASMTFACLKLWKEDVEQAKFVAMSTGQPPTHPQSEPESMAALPGVQAPPMPPPVVSHPVPDTFPGMEWNAFMEDFDWTFDPSILNAPVG